MRRVLSVMLLVGLSAVVVFAQGGAHSAHWYNQDAATGSFSVILNQPDGTESVVAVTREKGVDTTIAGIGVDMKYQRKILNCAPGAACFPPNIILGIDQNMNGRYDADDFRWQWSLVDETPLVADPKYLHGDTFLQCEASAPVGTPDPTWVLVDAYATYSCYHPNTAGTQYDLDYFQLSAYQLGLGAPDILPTSRVRALKVLAGGAGSWLAYDALVDTVTLGGALRIDEPNNSRSHFEVDTRK
jgi:hypothetical protein